MLPPGWGVYSFRKTRHQRALGGEFNAAKWGSAFSGYTPYGDRACTATLISCLATTCAFSRIYSGDYEPGAFFYISHWMVYYILIRKFIG